MNDMYTLLEARDYLHTTTITIKNYVVKNLLPVQFTKGGTMMFRQSDLDAIAPRIEEAKRLFRVDEGARKRRKDQE